jgi:hypothetical protein
VIPCKVGISILYVISDLCSARPENKSVVYGLACVKSLSLMMMMLEPGTLFSSY